MPRANLSPGSDSPQKPGRNVRELPRSAKNGVMKRWLFLALALAAVALPAASSGAESPLSIGTITAKFVPSEFATHYSVEAVDLSGKAVKFRWSLELELVDTAGAKNKDVPDSGAAVDLVCNNHEKVTGTGDEFVWHHADAPKDNCDHKKMGPKGHQGLIVVVVSDGKWYCVARYRGTNDGEGDRSRCSQDDNLGVPRLNKLI